MASITEKILEHDFKNFRQKLVRFGSLLTLHHYLDERHIGSIEHRFRLWPESTESINESHPVNVLVYLIPHARPFIGLQIPADSISIQSNHAQQTIEIVTPSVAAFLDQRKKPHRFAVAINPEQEDEEDVAKNLFRVFNRFLSLQDYVHVHAAALLFNELGLVFVGDKGSGKSTICLHLGMSGATILGEDHIMLRRRKGRFFASGCDDKMRVSQKSEKFFFESPLPETPINFAGDLKKEIKLSEYAKVLPYVDKPVKHIFFPEVQHKFSVSAITPPQAFQTLIEKIWPLHRFSDAQDQGRLMAFLGSLAMSTTSYQLRLSQDLTDLDLLNHYLSQLD